jgi:hypothetical protein
VFRSFSGSRWEIGDNPYSETGGVGRAGRASQPVWGRDLSGIVALFLSYFTIRLKCDKSPIIIIIIIIIIIYCKVQYLGPKELYSCNE